jgi:predicted DNA-binding protein with PD1-like motif
VQVARETNIVMVKLDDGADLMEALNKIILKENMKSGVVLMGIGMLYDVEVGYYDGQDYVRKSLPEPMELIALHGTIATVEGNPWIHLHCGLADKEYRLRGGHLFKGTVKGLSEICIMRLTDIELSRRKNESTGLMELTIHKASSRTTPRTRTHASVGRSMELDLD